jgi:hypothetical protein
MFEISPPKRIDGIIAKGITYTAVIILSKLAEIK